MSDQKLSEDATVADVLPTLDDPVEYLRRMLNNMMLCKREHGTAWVRIGITGRGIAPHYRVEPAKDMLDALLEGDVELSAYRVAYNGRSHKRLERGDAALKAAFWSRKANTMDEVQALLVGLRRRA